MGAASLPYRIIFAGTPEFAVPALEALIGAGQIPVAVYTQPDRPSGRGRTVRPGPVKTVALAHGIPVLQPVRLADQAEQQHLAGLRPDLLVVVAYGLILPRAVLDVPRLGCWNLHASLLPRWRGAAPIQRAIAAGDTRTGVCVMRMDAGLDTGPVYLCRSTDIAPLETGGSLHDRLARMAAEALTDCLRLLRDGALPEPTPQAEELATYATKITKPEARLDWARPAVELERQVRAFNPWPVAWFELGGKRLRVWSADLPGRDHNRRPGEVIRAGPKGIDIATGQGVLRILELQPEGKRRMSAADYLNAHRIT